MILHSHSLHQRRRCRAAVGEQARSYTPESFRRPTLTSVSNHPCYPPVHGGVKYTVIIYTQYLSDALRRVGGHPLRGASGNEETCE
eukprot:5498777-Amphidinium_carterae.1